jgi:penicillin-binding protein 2
MLANLTDDTRRNRRAAIGFTAIIVVLFGVAIARLTQIQIVDRVAYRRMAEENAVRLVVLPAARGVLRDQHGRLLVDSVPSFTLALDPLNNRLREIGADSVMARVALLINVPFEDLRERYVKQKGAAFGPVGIRRNLDIRAVAAIEEHRDELPGASIQTEPLRNYPGTLGAHVFGYLSEITQGELEEKRAEGYRPGDMIGRSGVEKQYEKYLRGKDGEEYVLMNALGQRIGSLTDRPPHLPVRGPDVYLTLDLAVQKAAEAAFPESLRGGLIALDPRNGRVLALVSRPSFDPHEFAVGLSAKRWKELLTDRSFPLLTRPIQAAYPPGSTWKPLTGLAGLENGRITPETRMVPCNGGFYYGHRWFRCWWRPGHGSQSFVGALIRSCDTYFYQVGLRVGIDPLYAWSNRCGLIGRTGIDLPQERKGFVPSVEWYDKHFGSRHWGRGVVLSLAIGQAETLATPVGLAAFYCFLVNGGNKVTPHLLLRVVDTTGQTHPRTVEPRPEHVNVSSATLSVIRQALEGVVSDPSGTGGRARIPGVRVGGKTGTAQNPHGKDHALFVGIAPMDAPAIVVAVVVENVGHGGTFAAPIARQVIEAVVNPPAPLGGAADTTSAPSD